MSETKIDRKRFVDEILLKQKELGLNDSKVAKQSGVSASSFSRIKNNGTFDFGNFAKLCYWLKVPLEHFTGDKQIVQCSGDTLTNIENAIFADKNLSDKYKTALSAIMRTAYETVK